MFVFFVLINLDEKVALNEASVYLSFVTTFVYLLYFVLDCVRKSTFTH